MATNTMQLLGSSSNNSNINSNDCTCSCCSSNALLLETLARRLRCCKEITFSQDAESPSLEYIKFTISTQSSSKSEGPTQLSFPLKFRLRREFEDNGWHDLEDNGGLDIGQGELQICSRKLLEQDLVACVANSVTESLQTIKFVAFNYHLYHCMKAVLATFVKRNKPLKRLTWDSCNCLSERLNFDAHGLIEFTELTKVCKLCEEFHLEHNQLQADLNGDNLESHFILSVLAEVTSLKVISISNTCANFDNDLVQILQANKSMKEFVLYNAVSGQTKTALTPIVDAMRKHPTLQKFTFLQSSLDSSLYKWAIATILENPNIIGLCTDGYYYQNATWLGRFLATNHQLTEVNLSHPGFEYMYDRARSPGGTMSLIKGLRQNQRITSITIVGLPIGARESRALRTLIEATDTVTKLVCGDSILMPDCFATIVGGLLSNTSIQKFSIQALDLDAIGVQTVAEVLTSNATLQSLSLSTHRRHYSLRNRSAPRINVEPSQIAAVIAAGLRQNTTLKHLSLPANLQADDCVTHFVHILESDPRNNATLERLTFWPKTPCPHPKIRYFTMLNRCGRQNLLQLQSSTTQEQPLALWAHIVATKPIDLVRYFIMQCPSLFDQNVCYAKQTLAGEIDDDIHRHCKKRVKMS